MSGGSNTPPPQLPQNLSFDAAEYLGIGSNHHHQQMRYGHPTWRSLNDIFIDGFPAAWSDGYPTKLSVIFQLCVFDTCGGHQDTDKKACSHFSLSPLIVINWTPRANMRDRLCPDKVDVTIILFQEDIARRPDMPAMDFSRGSNSRSWYCHNSYDIDGFNFAL